MRAWTFALAGASGCWRTALPAQHASPVSSQEGGERPGSSAGLVHACHGQDVPGERGLLPGRDGRGRHCRLRFRRWHGGPGGGTSATLNRWNLEWRGGWMTRGRCSLSAHRAARAQGPPCRPPYHPPQPRVQCGHGRGARISQGWECMALILPQHLARLRRAEGLRSWRAHDLVRRGVIVNKAGGFPPTRLAWGPHCTTCSPGGTAPSCTAGKQPPIGLGESQAP